MGEALTQPSLQGIVADLQARVALLERQAAQRPPRCVAGLVGADGSVLAGSGFSSAQNATGDYTVTYGTAFAEKPAVTITGVAGSGNEIVWSLTNAEDLTTGFRVQIAGLGGANNNAAFHFSAEGR